MYWFWTLLIVVVVLGGVGVGLYYLIEYFIKKNNNTTQTASGSSACPPRKLPTFTNQLQVQNSWMPFVQLIPNKVFATDNCALPTNSAIGVPVPETQSNYDIAFAVAVTSAGFNVYEYASTVPVKTVATPFSYIMTAQPISD